MMTARKRPSAEVEVAADHLTAPVEDYLKAIYDLESDDAPAATNDIAQRLGFAAASVSGMVRRLADAGLLAHEKYRGVRLTGPGRRAALRTVRRHRIIETYLTKVLGYPWDRVHPEADRLEHAASDELIDRMAAALGEPTVDPHGAPIPTREGDVDTTAYRSIAELPIGSVVEIVRVSDDDASRLRYLGDLGIVPGTTVTLVGREPFDGPLTLSVGGRAHAIGLPLAAMILGRTASKTPRRNQPR